MMMDDTPLSPHEEQDEPLDPALRSAAAAYNKPPTVVPRDAMWDAIQRARTPHRLQVEHGAGTIRRANDIPRFAWAWGRWSAPLRAAAACLLVALGISLGWWVRGANRNSVSPGPGGPIGKPVPAFDPAYRIAITRDLTQAEALLTAYHLNAQTRDADADAQLAQWAREILSNTQLLLDSPVGADPQRRQLLEDLELVLVQMTQPDASRPSTNREMIDRTLDHDHVLPRIRAAVPAGSAGT